MKEVLLKLWEKIKDFWNIYGGVALSTFIAWLTNWSKLEMDRWASYLILTLTCISLLTFFKIILFKKNSNGVPDSVALSQNRSVKTLRNAIEPEKTGEELGNIIIVTLQGGKRFMVKLKNFFKELWGNKFTISNTIIVLFLATLSQVMTYTEYLYKINWFAEHEMIVKILSPIIAAIWVFVDLFTTYTKYGFESLEELANRKPQKLSKEERKTYKNQLSLLENALETAEEKYNKYKRIISDTEVLLSANLALNSSERNEYDIARSQITELEEAISKLKVRIANIKEKL